MLSAPDGPFVQVARLNLTKYAQNPGLARSLFEHLFHQANDIRTVSLSGGKEFRSTKILLCRHNSWPFSLAKMFKTKIGGGWCSSANATIGA